MRKNNNVQTLPPSGSVFYPFPRLLTLMTGMALGALSLLPLLRSDPTVAQSRNIAVDLRIPPSDPTLVSQPYASSQADPSTPSALSNISGQPGLETSAPSSEWREDKVRPGDNLTSLFLRLQLDPTDALAVTDAKREAARLKNIKPGEIVAVAVDQHNRLTKVRYVRSPVESYVYVFDGAAFSGKKHVRKPDITTRFKQGIIQNSLSVDAGKAGLSQSQVMALTNIFGWDIDFARDIKSGDSFNVLHEEHFVDGKSIGAGEILAAEFTNRGKTYQAVRFVGKDGSVNYFSPDGKPMRKAFLRAPLDFMRVSSNFNMRRFHPVLKMVRPHRGVDYSAPTGTPVYAAGGGRVTASGFSGPNGNYVVIQHGARYTTKYLHLSRRNVKAGDLVKQGDTIGKVGSTGYATGSHLHYEFLIGGVHQDPRSAKMPLSEPIAEAMRGRFLAQTQPLMSQLTSLTTRVASTGDNNAAAPID